MDEGIRTRGGIEGEYLKGWRRDFQEELDSHNGVSLFVADTLEELAEQAGIEKAPFLHEVAHYNHMCEKGVDQDFGKNPRHPPPHRDRPLLMPSSAKWPPTGPSAACWWIPNVRSIGRTSRGSSRASMPPATTPPGCRPMQASPATTGWKAFADYQWAVDSGYLSAGKLRRVSQKVICP